MSPDLINGLIECGFGLMRLLDIKAAYKAKRVQGVSLIPVVAACGWGVWNIYFYNHIDQWYSFLGGLVILSTNLWWLYVAIKYRVVSAKV